MRSELAGRVLSTDGGAAHGRLSGELANIATSDAQRVGQVYLALPIAFAAVVGVLVGAVALLRVSVVLGLLVLVAAPVLLGLAHFLGKHSNGAVTPSRTGPRWRPGWRPT